MINTLTSLMSWQIQASYTCGTKQHKAQSTKRRKVALSGTMALQWITYKIGFFAIFFSILSTIQEQAAAAGSRMRRKTAKISAAARSSNNYLTTKALNSPCNSEQQFAQQYDQYQYYSSMTRKRIILMMAATCILPLPVEFPELLAGRRGKFFMAIQQFCVARQNFHFLPLGGALGGVENSIKSTEYPKLPKVLVPM